MKDSVKSILHACGLLPWLARRRGGDLILMFHGVGDAEMPVEGFERLLLELKRRFEVVSLDDLLARSMSPARRPRAVLTFDDGLRNNATLAHPLLRKHRVPATFYVCPGLVGGGCWVWTHELRERLRSLDEPARRDLIADLLGEDLPLEAAMRRIKDLPAERRLDCERLAAEATPRFSPSAAQQRAYDLMDWDELAALDPEWITVGCHGLTHAMLDSATAEEAEREVCESRAILERRLGREVRHFCYPDGRIGPEAESRVRASYASAVTTEKKVLVGGVGDPHRIPRLGGDPRMAEVLWNVWRVG
jgi:peptidoglycan/xylan/chitin deacetylase (PgdA/CDA1 family)